MGKGERSAASHATAAAGVVVANRSGLIRVSPHFPETLA